MLHSFLLIGYSLFVGSLIFFVLGGFGLGSAVCLIIIYLIGEWDLSTRTLALLYIGSVLICGFWTVYYFMFRSNVYRHYDYDDKDR